MSPKVFDMSKSLSNSFYFYAMSILSFNHTFQFRDPMQMLLHLNLMLFMVYFISVAPEFATSLLLFDNVGL